MQCCEKETIPSDVVYIVDAAYNNLTFVQLNSDTSRQSLTLQINPHENEPNLSFN